MFNQTNPENTADVETIRKLLIEAPIGETVTYTAITRAIGRDIQQHYWLLQRAREDAEKETGGIYETVRSEGVKRLPSDEIPDVGLFTLRKIKRAAKRGFRRLDGVTLNSLSSDASSRLIAHKSQLGAISLVSDGRRSVSITKEVTQTGATVPAGRVLEILKGSAT